jgi:hypothetical protein
VYGDVECAEYDGDAKDVAEVQNLKHEHVTTASVDPVHHPDVIVSQKPPTSYRTEYY